MRRYSTILAGTAVLALAAGGALYGWRAAHPTPAHAAPPPAAAAAAPSLPVAEVVVRDHADAVELTGTLEAVERVELRARVSGHIDAVAFPEGGLVKRGQPLFQIDPRPYQAVVARAHAELRQAEERLALATRELERSERLRAQDVIPQRELDRHASDRADARAGVDAARATLRSAQLDLENTRVRAPIDGRAGEAMITRGNLVAGGAGATPLTTIVSVDPVHVVFDVDEATYLRVAAADGPRGVDVALTGDEAFDHQGRIDFIGNELDAGSGTARMRAVLTNRDDRLRPGLFARVRLETAAPAPATLVRDEAVGTEQAGRFVLVVGAGDKLEARPVELGGIVDGLRLVRRGLAPGDRVVIGGLARPGMTITPRIVPMERAERAEAGR